ncbi:MAG: hypothetical protein IMY71_10800 [Bacteroidetes bacterium]|nr:hypothetical protein [Bacteroidota bacterium]
MNKIDIKSLIIILIHAFIGWVLCGAIMGIGMQVTSMESTLIIHAIGAPIFFAIVSLIYFKKFNYTTPFQTAIIFLAFVIFMDFFIVALLIEKSLEMFESILGIWLPFALIFISTNLTGLAVRKKNN